MKHIIAAIVLALSLGGGAATVALAYRTQAHPVSWWVAHPQDLKKKLAWCHDHPGDGGADCSNAWHADLHLYNQAFQAALAAERRR